MLYDASKEFEVSDYKLQVDLTVWHTVSLFVEFLFDRSQFMVKITRFTEPRAKCVGVDGLNTWIRFLFVNVRERKERNKKKKYSLMIWLTLNRCFCGFTVELCQTSVSKDKSCVFTAPQTYKRIIVPIFKCHLPRNTFLWLQKKSARAEEYIRMIKDRLPEAVQQCIHAAAGEYEPAVQRGLLRVNKLLILCFDWSYY